MVQGGLHRGVAVCMGSPGLPVVEPAPGLVHCHAPTPLHSPCSCTSTSWTRDGVRRGGPHGPSDTERGKGSHGNHAPFPATHTCSGDGERELVEERPPPLVSLPGRAPFRTGRWVNPGSKGRPPKFHVRFHGGRHPPPRKFRYFVKEGAPPRFRALFAGGRHHPRVYHRQENWFVG